MYSNIQDCDEVFNFWEPLHYLDRGHGFQTWETSPAFAIRSWAYILLHFFPAKLTAFMMGSEKVGPYSSNFGFPRTGMFMERY